MTVNRAKISVHISFIIFFVVYLFAADYIFNIMISTGVFIHKAIKTDFELPAETHNLTYHISSDRRMIKWKDALYISGWVLRDNVNESPRDVYLVLKHQNKHLIFDIKDDEIPRPDVNRSLNLDLNINTHGISLHLLTYWLKEDHYQVGFLVNDSLGSHYQMSDQFYLVNQNRDWGLILLHDMPIEMRVDLGLLDQDAIE